ERRAGVKRWIGQPLFIYSALRTWFSKYDRRHPHFALSVPSRADGAAATVRDGYFTVVLNASPYTYLGNVGLDLSPYATLDRGRVAITFRSLKPSAILGTLGRALRGRPVETSKAVDERHDLRALEIEASTPFPYQVDGDYLGETRRLRFEHRPAVLDLVL